MISRRSRIQEKRLTRKGLSFLLLSGILLVILLIFGIPTLARFSAFINDFKGSSTITSSEDKTPPGPPTLDSLPQYIKENKLTVAGRAEAGTTLAVYRNEEKVKELLIGDTSKFSTEIHLMPGENGIWGTSTDAAGNEGAASSTYKVTYDIEPPKLLLNKPSPGENFYGDQKTITIEGETELDAGVMINNRLAIVDSEGKFSQKITLSEGENKLTIVATDQAENKTEQTITVTYTP